MRSSQGVYLWGGAAVVLLAIVGIVKYLSFEEPSFRQDVLSQKEEERGEEVVDRHQNGKLYITTMTHMEGNFKDDQDEDLFLRHVEQIRWAMDLFDEYGAKLTIESEQSFAKANTRWGVPILREVVEGGHGVGTHADFGASPRDRSLTTQQLAAKFIANKKLIDDLVGKEHNIGVSGGTGYADWILAASQAGFSFMDGVTAFGYLSMPFHARPEGWTDEYIRSTVYHDPVPVDFEERLYPLPLANAEDLEADEEAMLVVMGGDIGELASLAEGRSNCFPNCVLDEGDVRVVEEALQRALAMKESERTARINMHIPLDLLQREYEGTLRVLLEVVEGYVERGEVAWATQQESYQGFVGE